ncbi:hypothetical protein GCM10009780_56030 [Actinomadura alba]
MPALNLLGSVVVPGRREEVAGVRGLVRELLGDEHPVLGDVELLTSEAVTNAIVHTASGDEGGTVTVWILAGDRGVRVEVEDGGGAVPAPRPYGDPWVEHGRGLWLVAAIATRHGYRRDRDGGTYWFEVHSGDAPATV